MESLFKNRFIQSVGVAAIVYIIFQALAWALEAILNILESFARWYRIHGIDLAEEVAIAAGVIFLIISAITSSMSTK